MKPPKLEPDLQKLVDARHHDPFSVLGKHAVGKQTQIRVCLPDAEEVMIAEGNLPMRRIPYTEIFEWQGTANIPEQYRLIWRDKDHREHITHDPYCFDAQVSDFDMHLFSEGKHWHAYRFLGSHVHEVNGVGGVLFALWAPNAERISVVGDFNSWDGRVHLMRTHGSNGIWELFIPDIGPGTLYKYEIRNRQSGTAI